MKHLQKNWLEWCVFAVSLILVTGTLAYLVYDAVTQGDTPPILEVRLGPPQLRSLPGVDHFSIPVTVTNHGDQTAEGVHVEVVLESEGQEPEQADFEIAFVPRQATRHGWVTFKQDPRTAKRLQGRVLGYEKP